MTSYYFQLNNPVIPQARTRFNGSYAYTPAPYRTWQENAIALFAEQKEAQIIKVR
ncbi:MAG: hypothetical protein AB4372_30565 [Xenococcus sp. (in: cyanobacteria)]